MKRTWKIKEKAEADEQAILMWECEKQVKERMRAIDAQKLAELLAYFEKRKEL